MKTNGWGTNQEWVTAASGWGSNSNEWNPPQIKWDSTSSEWGSALTGLSTGTKENPFQKTQWEFSSNVEMASVFNIKSFAIKFHFGTGKVFESNVDPEQKFAETMTVSPSMFSLPKPAVIKGGELPEANQNNDAGDVDDFDGESICAGVTGEEDDEVLFSEKARLFELTGVKAGEKREYAEISVDDLHFNKSGDFYRMVMRRSSTYLCLNVRITKQMKPKQLRNGKYIQFLCPGEKGDFHIRALQFENKEIADKLMSLWLKAIDELK